MPSSFHASIGVIGATCRRSSSRSHWLISKAPRAQQWRIQSPRQSPLAQASESLRRAASRYAGSALQCSVRWSLRTLRTLETSLPAKRLATLNGVRLTALLAAECLECAVSHFYRSIFGTLAIGCDVGGVGGEHHAVL